jgi:hypothetical protein
MINIFDCEWFVTILLVFAIGGIIFGMWYIHDKMLNENEEWRKQNEIKQAQERLVWSSLDCDGKKQYLTDGKDLTSSTIFYDNQNEQFYREFVLVCMDRPDLLESQK